MLKKILIILIIQALLDATIEYLIETKTFNAELF